MILHKFLFEAYDTDLEDNITATIINNIQDLTFIDTFSVDYKFEKKYNDLQVRFSYSEDGDNTIKSININIGSG